MVGDKEPHAYWFKTAEGYVTFIWKAGRLYAESNPPIGGLEPLIASEPVEVSLLDIVSGEILQTINAGAGESIHIGELAIDGNPIAIRWKTNGTLAN